MIIMTPRRRRLACSSANAAIIHIASGASILYSLAQLSRYRRTSERWPRRRQVGRPIISGPRSPAVKSAAAPCAFLNECLCRASCVYAPTTTTTMGCTRAADGSAWRPLSCARALAAPRPRLAVASYARPPTHSAPASAAPPAKVCATAATFCGAPLWGQTRVASLDSVCAPFFALAVPSFEARESHLVRSLRAATSRRPHADARRNNDNSNCAARREMRPLPAGK